MDKLSYIKQRFEGNFDVKYREVKTIIGDGTLVFIDDLCNGQWMMEYLILPLRGFGELKDSSIKTPNDLLEKVLDISAAGMAKDLDDALIHVLSGDADIGFAGSETTIYVYNGGEKDYLKTFAQLTQKDGSFIVSRKKIDNFTLDDLKGKDVIGGRAGGMPEMTFEWV